MQPQPSLERSVNDRTGIVKPLAATGGQANRERADVVVGKMANQLFNQFQAGSTIHPDAVGPIDEDVRDVGVIDERLQHRTSAAHRVPDLPARAQDVVDSDGLWEGGRERVTNVGATGEYMARLP